MKIFEKRSSPRNLNILQDEQSPAAKMMLLMLGDLLFVFRQQQIFEGPL
jgi:hypothetical protein